MQAEGKWSTGLIDMACGLPIRDLWSRLSLAPSGFDLWFLDS